MISTENKCIFIHISRTGGSSIEKAIIGKNWWNIEQDTKHISVNQAKNIYSEDVWNEFFTFSFVRNPWDRLVSLYKRFKLHKKNLNAIDLKEFILNLELHKNEKYKSYFYHEILEPNIDFIGRFENLQEDFEYICEKIGRKKQKLPHLGRTNHEHYSKYYTEETKELVAIKFKKDIELFNYTFKSE